MTHEAYVQQGVGGFPNDFHNPFKDFFRDNVSTFFQNCSIGFSSIHFVALFCQCFYCISAA